MERQEYVVDKILKRRKHGSKYHFLTLVKYEPTYDGKWQHASYFVDKDGVVNGIGLKKVIKKERVPMFKE